MRRLQVGPTAVTVGTAGSVRPVFVTKPRARRPILVGHVVRDPYCNCKRPHRWRAIPVARLELYRRLEAAYVAAKSESNTIALEVVAGPRLASIGAGVTVLVDGPWPALTASARRRLRLMGAHTAAHGRCRCD